MALALIISIVMLFQAAEQIDALNSSLETRSKDLQGLLQQKMDTESSLQQTQLENAQKSTKIETLESQLQAKATVKKPKTSIAVSGTCEQWIQEAGVTDTVNAKILINRESGCNPNSVNPSSGACGIPQALPCSKIQDLDATGQIAWMQTYVTNRYGSWSNAVTHSDTVGWY